MNKERWKQIDTLVAEALELPEDQREKFVSEKCVGDEDLRKSVLDLLNAEQASEDFMENSAMNVMAKAIADDSTTVLDNSLFNKKFGNYKIKNIIGVGGMGEVYLAHDEKLNRNIALKILPKEFQADDDRLERFKKEAKAIAKLNHPNIVTIYDFGKAEGVNYIATEYVEGKTLRDLIVEKIPLKKVLSIVLQSLEALSSAHKAGIIHRDIKPENIMVREDGYVKILDFGLVKLVEPELSDSGIFSKTMENLVIGTPAYMSPEQANGENVDSRTDLWSLGIVFYEMLTGENPFKRQNNQETLQAILSKEPPLLSASNPTVSPEIERILNKALQKDTDLGYQTAEEFKADVRRVKREIDSSPSWGTISTDRLERTESNRNYLPYLIFFFLLMLTGFGIWYLVSQKEDTDLNKWEKASVLQLTNQVGKELFPTISPDGKTFVYAADTEGNFDIYSRRIGSNRSTNLTSESKSTDTQPSFSPDGNLIAFRSDREPKGIYIMEVTGENPRRIADFGYHPSWSPDGKQLVVSEKSFERPDNRIKSAIWIINAENGNKRKLTGEYANQPTWSPNGKRIAYWLIGDGGRTDVATISVDGGEVKIVTDEANTNWNPVWSPDGKYLYFSSDRSGNMSFWRVPIDQTTGEILGEPELVPTPAKFNSHLSFSKDGKKLIYVQTNNESNIKAIEFDEKTEETKGEIIDITTGDYEFIRPNLSPDGTKFVVVQKKLTQDDIVVLDRNGKFRQDLLDDKFFDRYPRWSPDGNEIAFTSDRTGKYEIFKMQKDGSNLQQITFDTSTKSSSTSFPIWSPDGKKLAYSNTSQTYIIDNTKNNQAQNPQTLAESDEKKGFITWDWSSDGKKLAGIYHTKDDWSGLGFYSFETKKYERLEEVIAFPFWLPDSRRIIYSADGTIYVLNTDTKDKREIFSIQRNKITNAGISFDGKLLYFAEVFSESNIWLLDNSKGE